jgi:hypothetical protein
MIRYTSMPGRRQLPIESAPFHQYIVGEDTVWTNFYRSDKGYLLRFPDLADFAVSADGMEVVAYPTIEADDATIEHLYVNQLLPLALSRQGRPTFHASVVTVPGGVVAFLGKTGMGKSTLAASFALNDSTFLSDDSLLIEETDKACIALPGHASLRLWDDSAAALVDTNSPQANPISYSSKTRLLAGDSLAYTADPQPLVAAYLLKSNNAANIEIRPLDGIDRHMAWLHNSFLLDIEDPDLLGQHFDWTHRIARSVPTFALDYPRDYGILLDVRNAVRQHAAQSGY